MFSIKICCFKRQAQKQLPQHHLMCRDDVKQESHWMPRGEAKLPIISLFGKTDLTIAFSEVFFTHIF